MTSFGAHHFGRRHHHHPHHRGMHHHWFHHWPWGCKGHGHGRPAELEDADIFIEATAGERRVVAYEVVNDSQCDVTVEPEIGPFRELCSDEVAAGASIAVQPMGAKVLAPCEKASYRIRIDLERLAGCGLYEVEVRFRGTCCGAKIRVSVAPPSPIVCRHDPSHLRAWLKRCCFGWEPTKLWAPSPLRGSDCGHCGHCRHC